MEASLLRISYTSYGPPKIWLFEKDRYNPQDIFTYVWKSFLIKYNVSAETIDASIQLSESYQVAPQLISIAKFSKLFCWAT